LLCLASAPASLAALLSAEGLAACRTDLVIGAAAEVELGLKGGVLTRGGALGCPRLLESGCFAALHGCDPTADPAGDEGAHEDRCSSIGRSVNLNDFGVQPCDEYRDLFINQFRNGLRFKNRIGPFDDQRSG
jgi:hypothetical protein